MKPSKTPLTQSLKIALYTTAAVSGAVSAAETELKSDSFTIPTTARLNYTTIASAEKVAQSLNVTNIEVNNNTTKVKALEAQVEQHGSIITMLEQQMTANNTNTITYIDDTKKKLETDVNNLGDALDAVRTQTGLQEGEINKLKSDLDNYVKADDFANIMTEVGNELDTRFGDINDELNKKINTEDAQKLLDAQIGNVTDRIELVDDKVEALNTQVQGKADKNLVDDVITTLNDKADRSELANKANQADLDELKTETAQGFDLAGKTLTTYTDKKVADEVNKAKTEIDTKLDGKADKSDLDKTNENLEKLNGKIDEKTDIATVQGLLDAQIGNVNGRIDGVDKTIAQLDDKKADKTEVATVKNTADTAKQIADTALAGLSEKANVIDVNNQLAQKADQSDLDKTNAEVATKIGAVEALAIAEGAVSGVEGRATALEGKVESLETAVQGKADKNLVDDVIITLNDKADRSELANKANQSDLDELKTKTGEMIGDLATITQDAFARTDAEIAKKANTADVIDGLGKVYLSAKDYTDSKVNDINAELADKADKSDLDNYVKADDFANIMTEVGNELDTRFDNIKATTDNLNANKADKSEITRLDNDIDQTLLAIAELAEITNEEVSRVDNKVDQLADATKQSFENVKATTDDLNENKADKSELARVEKGAIDSVKELATITQDAFARTDAEVAKKANQSDLENLKNATEANIAELQDFANATADAFQNVASDMAQTNNRIDENTTAIDELEKIAEQLNKTADDLTTKKADQTALDETNQKLNTYAHELYTKVGENIADINGLKADKADTATVNAELAKKADTAAVNAELAKKADKVETEKALADNKTAIENTNAKLDTYAHELYTKVGENIADINGLKADKADKTALAETDKKVADLEANKANKAETEKALADNKTAIENTNTKLDTYAHELYTKVGENIADINGLKADKADKTAVNAELAKKADTATVNAELAKKADKAETEKALAENKTAIENTNTKLDTYAHELYTKVGENIADINGLKADKADKTALAETDKKVADLETNKADKTTVNAELAKKADTAAVNAELAKKADKAETEKALAENKTAIENTNTKLDTYAHELYTKVGENIADINGLKADKADKATVNAELAKKADQTALDETNQKLNTYAHELYTKVGENIADINGLKADKADKTALAETDKKVADLETNKADKATVNAELAKKAGQTALDETNDKVAKLETSKADKADIDNKIKGLETQFATEQATINNTATNALNTANAAVASAANAGTTATNALNAANANTVRINGIEQQVGGLNARMGEVEKRLGDLDNDFKSGMATQAALNGLFQPYTIGRANTSIAIGGYDSKTAIAIGAGYRFNEKIATKAAFSTDGSNASYNLGVNFEW